MGKGMIYEIQFVRDYALDTGGCSGRVGGLEKGLPLKQSKQKSIVYATIPESFAKIYSYVHIKKFFIFLFILKFSRIFVFYSKSKFNPESISKENVKKRDYNKIFTNYNVFAHNRKENLRKTETSTVLLCETVQFLWAKLNPPTWDRSYL